MPFIKRGDHHSDASRAKMSEARRGERNVNYGKARDPETCMKISLTKKNQHVHPTEETRKKMSLAKKNKPFTPEHKAAIGAANSRRIIPNEVKIKISTTLMGKYCGKNHPNWQGGISFEPYCPKFNEDLKRRVRAYFENRCMLCGMTVEENGENLSVHHVSYDKMVCCNGRPVHFAALCHRHHTITNYDRSRWEYILHRIIDEIWEGRSYYTKEEYKEVNA